jgi:CubicO group peptidase (beta-lactamase class C family)
MDLKSFAQEYLFSPLGAEVGDWLQYEDGYYSGLAGMHLSARDAAKLGLLHLNDGEYEGKQVLSADWIRDSLQRDRVTFRLVTNALVPTWPARGESLRKPGFGLAKRPPGLVACQGRQLAWVGRLQRTRIAGGRRIYV